MPNFLLEIFRWIGTVTGWPAQWIFFKKKVYFEGGDASLRRIRGGALIISNHFNPLDYVANAFLVFPRKLFVVASEDAFRNPWITFGMSFFGGIQANRVTRDMSFLDRSAAVISRGHLVQIFPEGRNTPDGKIHKFFPSYIGIARRANCPIIPVVSDGNYGLFRRLHVIIGQPIRLSELLPEESGKPSETRYLNDNIRQHVLDLRAELDRLVEADRRRKGN